MEKEFNRNRNSYRSGRTNNRYNQETGRENKSDRFTGEGRRERREPGTDRYGEQRRERTYNRDNSYNKNREFRPGRPSRFNQDQPERKEREERKNTFYRERPDYTENNYRRNETRPENRERAPFRRENPYGEKQVRKVFRKRISEENKEELRQKHYSKKKLLAHRLKKADTDKELRLNRYISISGVCSRRDADELILAGRVKVNGEVVQTVGIKVKRTDKVEVDDMPVLPERKVYIVLNKPKDYVTTVEDPLERKTVMALVEDACKERIYPIGRLDRQTTGVLLFTNDGELAKKLTHPKYNHKKIYHVFLDKPVSDEDMRTIMNGVELEDGFIKPDEINFTSPDHAEVGMEIHSGKNRIVRRIFEHFGYQIVRLDRVYFAGITKKNLPRGRWRFLTPQEVNMLKVY